MPTWNKLFEQREFRRTQPDEQVVALVPLLEAKGARRILDLACGAGRHLVYLARAGFQIYGLDIAESGLEYARQWLDREGLNAGLAQSEMSAIPYSAQVFDAAICIHAIQHQTRAGLQKTVSELYRVLRPGGLVLATFPSQRDRRYGQGQEIEPNTFLAEQGPDTGVPHHYCNLAEIEGLFEGFVLQKIEIEEHVDEQNNRFSHWQVLARRE